MSLILAFTNYSHNFIFFNCVLNTSLKKAGVKHFVQPFSICRLPLVFAEKRKKRTLWLNIYIQREELYLKIKLTLSVRATNQRRTIVWSKSILGCNSKPYKFRVKNNVNKTKVKLKNFFEYFPNYPHTSNAFSCALKRIFDRSGRKDFKTPSFDPSLSPLSCCSLLSSLPLSL